MSDADIARMLIMAGIVISFLAFIFAVANITGLVGRGGKQEQVDAKTKSPFHFDFSENLRRQHEKHHEWNRVFRRHGIAMVIMIVAGLFIALGVFIGGVDLLKEILGQFGISIQ